LGLPDDIIEDAKMKVGTENAAFEDALSDLEQTRRTLESEKSETEKLLREADIDRQKALEMKKQLDSERSRAAKIAKREANLILKDARKAAETVMNELQQLRNEAAQNADLHKLNEAKAEMLRKLNEAESRLDTTIEKTDYEPPTAKIVPGDKVRLRSLGTLADVISVSQDGVLTLQAGIMKITAKAEEVALVENDVQEDIKKHISKSQAKLRNSVTKSEVDLRGMNADEAIQTMERFLDNARLAKLNIVTIIHGKGTGVLRKAVHNNLKREQKGIKSFRLGLYGEGEDGVTIVEL
jgi:DNA mismatch repair protein MutS2